MSGGKNEAPGKGSGGSVSRGCSSAAGSWAVSGGRTVMFSQGQSRAETEGDSPEAAQQALLAELHRLTGLAADTLRVTGVRVTDDWVTLSVRLPRESLSEAARQMLAELLLQAD